MDKKQVFVQKKLRAGWVLIAVGVVLFVVGIAVRLLFPDIGFNTRIISGLGILSAGVGFGRLVLARAASKDDSVRRQLYVEEQDERLRAIRNQAGARAYLAALVISMIGLMWVSFSANGSLPVLSQDALWYYLVGLVIVPFLVFTASQVLDQRER